MKKSLLLLLAFASLSGAVFAQSGRKAAPAPSRSAGAATDDEYSESRPNAGPTYSRKKPSERPVAVQPKPDTTISGDEDTIKVSTDLVTIPVSVYERSGVYVSGLRRSDFRLFEDGKEQEIAYFGTVEVPFSVILLIDTSGSTDSKIKNIQDAALSFIRDLRPEDKVMVIDFNFGVNVRTVFTSNRAELETAIRRISAGGGTSLYRAVDVALGKKFDDVKGRKAIVLFTDGVDTTSGDRGYEQTLAQAEEGDAVIYSVYYNTYLEMRGITNGGLMSGPVSISQPPDQKGYRVEDYAKGKVYLAELSRLTGGKVFNSDSTTGGLSAAFAGIAEELGNQYTIGYYSSEQGAPGQRKQIRVRVNRPNMAVRARDFYIVGETPQKPAASK